MATQAEIAGFFRLALQVGLLDKAAIERWADSVIANEPIARFPFTELAGASKLRPQNVDELLQQVPGNSSAQVPARLALTLLRRELRDGKLTSEAAVKTAYQIARAGGLSEDETNRVDILDDDIWLASSGIYGDLERVRQRLVDFLDKYQASDAEIPAVV